MPPGSTKLTKKTDIDIVFDIITALLANLFENDAQGNPISETIFSQELLPAFRAIVFTWLEQTFPKNVLLMELCKEQLNVILGMGICIGFNLANKESPITYADNFVRRECEKRGIDFQAVAERIGGRQE